MPVDREARVRCRRIGCPSWGSHRRNLIGAEAVVSFNTTYNIAQGSLRKSDLRCATSDMTATGEDLGAKAGSELLISGRLASDLAEDPTFLAFSSQDKRARKGARDLSFPC